MQRKKFWVSIVPFDAGLLTTAIEAGADAVVIPEGKTTEAKRLGKIATVAADGDLQWGRDLHRVRITCEEDEARVGGDIPTVIENDDWTIIPLENLIARGCGELIQTVRDAEQARTAVQVMERGADGILLVTGDAAEIKRTGQAVERHGSERLALEKAAVTATRAVVMSDRCCLDTTSLLPPGTGLLVGNTAGAMFLVHNENVETPYCAARPFRVNAGAVHAYCRVPGDRTKYLCELAAGDEVLAVDPHGATRTVAVGRNKIERRPMMLVSAEGPRGRGVSIVLQNAETVRLTRPDGTPAPVTTLQEGDEVLACFGDAGGRHFGRRVEETIDER